MNTYDEIKRVGLSKEKPLYLLIDENKAKIRLTKLLEKEGAYVMDMREIFEKNPFNILDKIEDYEKLKEKEGGYFIYLKENARPSIPIQSCLFIKNTKVQKIHNVIYLEKNSKATITSGCLSVVDEALHLGKTTTILEENSSLVYSMIHSWKKRNEVKPEGKVFVGEKANYQSIYANVSIVKEVNSLLDVFVSKEGKATLTSVILSGEKSRIKLDERIYLEGARSEGEILSRILVKDEGKVETLGTIFGKGEESKGFIECKGLLTTKEAKLITIPKLVDENPTAELSHEAFIGKLDVKKLYYLLTKGISPEKAKSLLLKSFFSLDLPIEKEVKLMLDATITEIIKKSKEGIV